MNLFFICINLLMAVLIYFDANKFKKNGLKIVPVIWSLLIFLFSFFGLLFYLIMRYAAWKVQIKATHEPNLHKRSSTTKIIIRLSIILIIFVFFSVFAGCHMPFVANFVHKKIKLGMSVNEVVSILTKYKGYHSYWVQLINPEKVNECNKIKPEYEECLKSGYSIDCDKKFPKYRDDCMAGLYRLEEFIKITNDVASKKVNYTIYKAEVSVLFMGPVFLHNSFKIYFDSQGKVESVTPVEHWD